MAKVLVQVFALLLFVVTSVAHSATVDLIVRNSWGSGFQGEIVIHNDGSQPISNWVVQFNSNFDISTHWNAAEESHDEDTWSFSSLDWNGAVASGQATAFGFIGIGGSGTPVINNISLRATGLDDSSQPTPVPTPEPTSVPTPVPTFEPTPMPTIVPTVVPTPTPGLGQMPDSGRYVIVSRASGYALDVASESSENGAVIHQWGYGHKSNQQFDLAALGNGYFSIRPANSGKSVDVWEHSTVDGGEIRQYSYYGTDNQQWVIREVESGYYQIVSRLSGKALTVADNNQGTDILQYTYTGATNQQWMLQSPSDMYSVTHQNLVWSDEFDYTGLPSDSYWGYERGMVRNNEDQYYTVARSQNAWVEEGVLTISALRERYEEANYTSASISTSGKVDWTYGRFDLRAKIDVRAGLWPAFWMLGYGKWPENGELDIMEYYQGKILANVAWKANNSDSWSAAWDSSTKTVSSLNEMYPNWANEFHIWRMDWDRNYIRLYVDGILLNETNLNNISNPDGSNPFRDKPMYMILNLALGGNNGGDPSGTSFPATYQIDYVRVYQ